MKIRSKAPLRIGIAGGGTDVSPYSDQYGGCVLNATINLFAHTFIERMDSNSKCIFAATDLGIIDNYDITTPSSNNVRLKLHVAVYNRVMKEFNDGEMLPLKVTTMSDAPPGSGLGTSSTLVVSMLEAYKQLLSLPLGEYDIAHLAFQIERIDCGLSGGKQDQYAATFGGFNFIEFYSNDRVIVNPLRIRRYIISELEASMILFFTGTSRDSAKIIQDQINSVSENDDGKKLDAMHSIKASAFKMKEYLFKGDVNQMSIEIRNSWKAKKLSSSSISNPKIDEIEKKLISSGAKSWKISGAGGGGFMMIFVEPELKNLVINALSEIDGKVHNFQFTEQGAYSWTI